MSPHEGCHAPTSSMVRSNGPSRSRITWYSVVRPVSLLKNTACRGECTTSEDQSVELRVLIVRPEKCWEGAAVTLRSALGSKYDSHQSSSTMRSGATPHASRCAPTPSEVTNGTVCFLNCRIVG